MRPHALHPGAIQGKEGIKFCHLATLFRIVLSLPPCSYVIPSLAASVVINIPKYFESTLDYYPVGETPTLLDNGTTVNVTKYQVRGERQRDDENVQGDSGGRLPRLS